MFSSKKYSQVNREERHFCFLLAHSILSSDDFRAGFTALLESELSLSVGKEIPDVYLEAATLRDYWRDLGDPVAYTPETHANRKSVVDRIVEEHAPQIKSIDEHDFFWTARHKLWSPGRWSNSKLKRGGFSGLLHVKWAFNAKPDLMLDFNSVTVLIEAKVESPVDRDRNGYDQLQAQELISTLLVDLVPSFRSKHVTTLLLSNTKRADIHWKDLIALAKGSGLDAFTKESFGHMGKAISA